MEELNSSSKKKQNYACPVCGLPSELKQEEHHTCERCGHKDSYRPKKATEWCLAFSLAAMVLYVPANLLPFMTVNMYGNIKTSTIMGGIVTLIEDGSFAIAAIIFIASVILPLLKILMLFYLCASMGRESQASFRMKVYRFVEFIGRWSMLDIFLLAILVSLIKLGHWAEVHAEIGALLFGLVVIFTMLASSVFDPRILWEGRNEKNIR